MLILFYQRCVCLSKLAKFTWCFADYSLEYNSVKIRIRVTAKRSNLLNAHGCFPKKTTTFVYAVLLQIRTKGLSHLLAKNFAKIRNGIIVHSSDVGQFYVLHIMARNVLTNQQTDFMIAVNFITKDLAH